MRHHVQRMVKRGNCRYGRQRLPQRMNASLFTVWCDVARKGFAVVFQRELSGKCEDVEGPTDFVYRIFATESALGGYEGRQWCFVFFEERCSTKENSLALVSRQCGLVTTGDLECVFNIY